MPNLPYMPKNVIISGFIYIIRHIVKNSHKLVGIAIIVVLTLGTALSLAVNSNSDLTGRVQLTKEESLKLRKEIGSRKENASSQREKKSVEPDLRLPAKTKAQRNDFIGNGVLPDGVPVIETYIGACNDPFGTPTCVVDGQYTTYDLAYNGDEVVYTMRVKNTSTTTPTYMDKVFLEYYVKGIDQTVWNRTEWKIYDASAPSTLLTRGHVYNAANVNGYVDFDWSYPGSLSNPINQPPVILPLGTQTYIVTADIVDDTAGPNTFDYVQVRANDSLTFTPVMGGTLADAHSVDSHFIWHTASGLYYNEGYTDLMDMWGGVPNAFAQWRKRMWGGPVCGNGSIETGEACDDGNLINGDGCANSCQYEFCGDGYLDLNGGDNVSGSPDDEACDDGNAINGDGCSMTCELESTVTLNIDNTTGPSTVEWTHAGMPIPWYMRSAMVLDVTPSAPVTIPNYRMNLNFELETDGMTATGMAPITSTQCANLGTMQVIANQKVTGFEMSDVTVGDILLSTVTGQINVTGTTWMPGTGIYLDDFCVVDGYVDVDFGGYVFPASTSNILIEVGHNSERLFPWEEYHFDTLNVPATTTAIDSGGSPLSISQFTGPISLNGYDVTVDEDRLRIIEPSSSLTPYQMTAQQGESDVVLGVFTLINLSHSQGVIVNDINIFDFLGVANTTQPDITNIRLYEYDFATSSTIGAPLASGLNMMFGNQVTATGINLFLSSPGSSVFIAVVGDISPTYTDSAGFDVGWEGGSHNPDTDTLPDNNEIHLSLNANGLANPLTASPAWNVPFEFMFNQCDTSVGNPYLDGCWTGPFNRVYNLNMTLGNLVDVLPATAPMGPVLDIQFQMQSDYDSIIVPTGSGFSNAVKIADFLVNNYALGADVTMNRFQLSNPDLINDFTQRFGTFYLVDQSTGNLIDTAVMTDAGAASDGIITFSGFTWTIPDATYANLDVLAEVMPITQAYQSGSYLNLYLAGTGLTDVEIHNDSTGAILTPGQINNVAINGHIHQQLHVTRRTKPTITYNNSAVGTTITGTVSAKEMYRFSISADPVGDLDWQHLTLDSLETAGINSSNYRLYIVGQPTALNTVGVSAVGGEVTIIPDTIQTIPAGTTVDYALRADIMVTTPAVSQTVSNTLTADDDCCIVTNNAPFLTFNDFVWSDRSAVIHNALSMDWTNGYLVEEFDVDTVNINYSGTGGGPVSYTRTDLLTDLFSIKGQPLMSGPSGCTDTTPAQEAVWATGINLGIIWPYSTGFCGPNDPIVRAGASKVLASYSAFISGNMTIISPLVQTFPDVILATWYFDWVESMYAAMGTVYAIAGSNFYPGNLLDSITAVTWITNLP